MNKWRDGKGVTEARVGRGPLSVNDNRAPCPWEVKEQHSIVPIYRHYRPVPASPVAPIPRWFPIAGIVAALAVLAVIYA